MSNEDPAAAPPTESSPPETFAAEPADPAIAALKSKDRTNLVLALLGITGAMVAVFLLASGILSGWDGQVAAIRPRQQVEAPTSYDVLVVEKTGREVQLSWPTDLVSRISARTDRLLLTPPSIPAEAPVTTKGIGKLYFLVQGKDGNAITVPTTSPAAFGLAILVGLIGLATRNALATGSALVLLPNREPPPSVEHLHAPLAPGAGPAPTMTMPQLPTLGGAPPAAAPAEPARQRPGYGPPPSNLRGKKSKRGKR